MKRFFRYLIPLLLPTLLLVMLTAFPVSADEVTLNIYNWGEYLSYDDEDAYDVLIEFEKYYEKTYGKSIEVNYSEFDSNESLYAKIKK